MACPDCGVFNCPDCGGVLVPLNEKLENGKDISINYCFSCGGYWCDHWKANDISYNDFVKLSAKLPVFDKETVYGGNGKCPFCSVLLDILRSESVPVDLRIKVCPQCQGNWFPQGQFSKFKIAQKAKLDYFKTWNIPIQSIFQVLIPVFILVFLGASIPVSMYLSQKQQNDQISASELVHNVQVIPAGEKQVIIAFSTNIALPTEVEYGKAIFDFKKVPVSVSASTFHSVHLANLDLEKYYYRIIVHEEGRAIPLPLRSFTVR